MKCIFSLSCFFLFCVRSIFNFTCWIWYFLNIYQTPKYNSIELHVLKNIDFLSINKAPKNCIIFKDTIEQMLIELLSKNGHMKIPENVLCAFPVYIFRYTKFKHFFSWHRRLVLLSFKLFSKPPILDLLPIN